MTGLSGSRWAVKDGRSSSVPAQSKRLSLTPGTGARERNTSRNESIAVHPGHQPASQAGTAASELLRYSMIVRRMKWKLPFLELAYHQATEDANGSGAAGTAEAELMFKLDFFEYYMLCERALVHLLGVFGVSVSAGTCPGSKPAAETKGSESRHRYHANVLEALGRPDNPLHAALGVGSVRKQLFRAKDLRNRWKNVDSDVDGKAKAPPLASYDLAGILTTIHQGLDSAFLIASSSVADSTAEYSSTASCSRDKPFGMEVDPGITDEERWEFMVEAMDWEAI